MGSAARPDKATTASSGKRNFVMAWKGMSEGRAGIIIGFPVFAETGAAGNPHNW
jgi:hypothetical protein